MDVDQVIGHWLNLAYLFHPGNGHDWKTASRHYIFLDAAESKQLYWNPRGHQWTLYIKPSKSCDDILSLYQLWIPSHTLKFPEHEYTYRFYGRVMNPELILETFNKPEYQPKHLFLTATLPDAWSPVLDTMERTQSFVDDDILPLVHTGIPPSQALTTYQVEYPGMKEHSYKFKELMKTPSLMRKLHDIMKNNYKDPSTLMAIVRQYAYSGDLKVYQELRQLVHGQSWDQSLREAVPREGLAISVFSPEVSIGRGMKRAQEIQKALPRSFHVKSLLDIGCSDGSNTDAMASLFQLDRQHIFGTDIVVPQAVGDRRFSYLQVSSDSAHIPLDDSSVQVITAIMSLHHIPYIDEMMTEIKRVLDPDGLVIIREHDSSDPKYHVLLDVVHGLYDLVWSQPMENPLHLETFWAKYQSRQQWRKVFGRHGFRYLTTGTKQPYGVYRAYVDAFTLT